MTGKVDSNLGGGGARVDGDVAAFDAALTGAQSRGGRASSNGAEGPVAYSGQGSGERGPAVAYGSGTGASTRPPVAYSGASAPAAAGASAGAVAYTDGGGRGPAMTTEASAGGALVYSTPVGAQKDGPAVVYQQGPGGADGAMAQNAASTIQQLTTMYNLLRSMIASNSAMSQAQTAAMLNGQAPGGAGGGAAGALGGMSAAQLAGLQAQLAEMGDQLMTLLPTDPGPIEAQGGAADAPDGDAHCADGHGEGPDGPVKVENGRIWGDPHFVGADGGKYDVQGQAGTVYNILSDQGVQVNALFKDWTNPGTTVVQTYGVTIGGDQITVGANGALSINGEAIRRDGKYIDGSVVKSGDTVTIEAGEYTLEFSDTQRGFVNNLNIRAEDANSDHVLPHGLWGVTVDGDGQARDGDRGKGMQGGGAIEGLDGKITTRGDKHTVEAYEVDGLFDTTFDNFNKFDAGRPGPGFNACFCGNELLFANFNIDINIAIQAGLEQVAPEVQGDVAVENGRIWGDPHFIGADGGKYDVQGEAGKTYNILSDTGVQMNAAFKAWDRPGTTVVENVGISTGGNTIEIGARGGIRINGEDIAFPAVIGQDFDLPFGLGTKNADGSITVNAGEYTLTFSDFQSNAKSGAWINNIEIRSDNANADHVLPHGLWGVTVDGDGEARNGDQGKGMQGGGALEGLDGTITERGDTTAVSLYEVDGLFDTNFHNFNRFENGQIPAAGPGFNAQFSAGAMQFASLNIDIDVAISAGLQNVVMSDQGAAPVGDYGGLNVTQDELERLAMWEDQDDLLADVGQMVDELAARIASKTA